MKQCVGANMKTTLLSNGQIQQLRDAYNGIETAPISILPKFHALFAKMPDATIFQVKEARIKFVSGLALNELIRRGLI